MINLEHYINNTFLLSRLLNGKMLKLKNSRVFKVKVKNSLITYVGFGERRKIRWSGSKRLPFNNAWRWIKLIAGEELRFKIKF